MILSRLYTFAIMWSIAAVLESADRQMLEEYIKTDLKDEMNIPKLKVNPVPILMGMYCVPKEWYYVNMRREF